MIIQCPACRALATVESALVDDAAARAGLRCSACGVVSWLPAERAPEHVAASTTATPTPPSSTSSLVTPAPASAAVAPAAPSLPADPALEEAALGLPASTPEEQALVDGLRALLPRWDDAKAHRALIQSAHEAGALAALGVRYRRVLEVRPGDEAAKRAQQEILNLALASFSSMHGARASELDEPKRLGGALALAVAGVVLLVACGVLFFALKSL